MHSYITFNCINNLRALKIFLTHAYYLKADKNELQIMKPYPPLGLLCISAYLKQAGYETYVFDSTFSSFEEQKQVLIDQKPDLVAIYCNLMTKLNVIPLIKFIKSESYPGHAKILLGGPEPSNHAEQFLNTGADFIAEGEGEVTVLELIDELCKKHPNPSGVNGLIYRNQKGVVIKTPPRAMITDIDVLPFPDRKSIDVGKYLETWKSAHGYSSVSINTMRGCPYTCRWCSHSVYGVSYRRRSPELVADEVELILRLYNPDMFWFVDDVFTVSHKWLTKLLEVFTRRKIKIRFECISRSDRLNDDVIRMLKELGCFRLWIGAESGSQKVIDLMDRRVNTGQVREMIMLTKKHGIEAGTFIMLGYPGETKEDIKITAEHLKISMPDIFLTTVAYPIKGTPFYSEVESRLISDLAWENHTDRDLDFKGRFSKRFYRYANRYIVNYVGYHKMKAKDHFSPIVLGKTYLKTKISSILMSLTN